jgi:hypothetical protein
VFSNTDESVRRLPRRPASAALRRALARGFRAVSSGGRHLGSGKLGGVDVPSSGTGPGRQARDASACLERSLEREVSEGSIDGAAARADKAAALSPTPRERANQGGRREARSRRRAVKRAAVGGRMTARWSGVFLGDAETRVRGGSGRRTSAGFPTALGGQSPKVGFLRVLVTRNVGCRNGSRGTLTPPPRKAARPHEGATPSDGRGD